MKRLHLFATVSVFALFVSPVFAQDPVAADLRRLADILDARIAPAVVQLPAGGNLRDAVNSVSQSPTGAVIELQPGIYPGPVVLPSRPVGSPVIVIKTAGGIPARPLTDADLPLLARFASATSEPALTFQNTSGYTLDGIGVLRQPNGYYEGIVVQDGDNITIDRTVIYAPEGQKRGIRLNGTRLTVTRSWINTGAWQGQDSQGILVWEGSQFTITHNYIAASGENVLFGGAWTVGRGAEYIPQDATVQFNVLHKPQEWRQKPGSVKNLFELKNVKRILVADNLFDGNWTDAQPGWGIVFTVRNQEGTHPFATIEDVIFERNYIKNTERGFNLLGQDNEYPSQRAKRITIRKNVVETAKQFIQIHSGVDGLTIEDNVVENGYNTAMMYVASYKNPDGTLTQQPIAAYNVKWNRNYYRDAGYGIHCEVGIGTACLNARTSPYEFLDNKFVNRQYTYPATTLSIDEATLQGAKAALLAELGR